FSGAAMNFNGDNFMNDKNKYEEEWEKEYNLKKEKRKWLLKKKKEEFFSFLENENVKKRAKKTTLIILIAIIAPLVSIGFFILLKGYVNYSESSKFKKNINTALFNIERNVSKKIGSKYYIADTKDMRQIKTARYLILSNYHIYKDSIIFNFTPDFKSNEISQFPLESEIFKLAYNRSIYYDEKSSINQFVCSLSNTDDLKSLAYSNFNIILIVPNMDRNKFTADGGFSYLKLNKAPISYTCDLDVKWGFMSGIKSITEYD
ncbi:hypothetical protein, partial [Citrobacter freundii]|uniref:hypothetical protein n=1 Tax=Citrobacter freundii TaxID=546 RepID=UPI0023AED350